MEPTRTAASAASETCLTILLGRGGYEDQSEYNEMRIRGYTQGLGRDYFLFLREKFFLSGSCKEEIRRQANKMNPLERQLSIVQSLE